MGLLDDAIREHLDLKRRRGADPAEIERAEREALGPVRRGPEGAQPDQLSQDDGAELAPEYESEAEPDWNESFSEEPTAYHEPADPLPEESIDAEEEADPAHEPLAREDPEAERQPLHPDAPAPGGETAEYDVGQELGQKQEDVLEETPEFLQDAPEHDRLWFEQRPPRDFDFEE